MKTPLTLAVCLAVTSPMLAACPGQLGGVPGANGTTDIVGALKEIASDPRCGHVDRIQGNLGGLTGNNLSIYFERTCPMPQTITPLSEYGKAPVEE